MSRPLTEAELKRFSVLCEQPENEPPMMLTPEQCAQVLAYQRRKLADYMAMAAGESVNTIADALRRLANHIVLLPSDSVTLVQVLHYAEEEHDEDGDLLPPRHISTTYTIEVKAP